jgi:predicted ATPase
LWTDIFSGFAMARGGRFVEGIQIMEKALKVFADMNYNFYKPYRLGLKARAYEKAGDFDHALASVAEAIAFAKETGEKVVLSDLIRLSGELHLARSGGSAAEAAENSFAEAIGLAQAQESKLHEIRAATSLARLWRDQGKHAEAREALSPVYSWFTEGLDSRDLLDARAVLDELSAEVQRKSA